MAKLTLAQLDRQLFGAVDRLRGKMDGSEAGEAVGGRAELFLRYAGTGGLPSQIHSYLSSNLKELRSLETEDPAKAKDSVVRPRPAESHRSGEAQ